MPQLAAHQLIGANFSFQHFPFDEVARTIRGFGLLEIELWGIAQHLDLFHATDARVESIRRVLADNELSAWCFTPEQVLYPINIASGDAALRQDSIERFCRAADICAALGARYLFLTPGRGYESEPRQPAWDRAVGSIGEIARRAAANGVRCLLEPLQRFESNLVNNAAGLRQMLDEVGAGNVDVVLDTVAMATAGDTVAGYVDLFGSRLAHVHLVDGTPGGHLVWGEGTLPLDHYVSELARLGYAGKFTFEPFGNGSYALDPVKAWTRCLGAIAPYIDRATVPA
ncbi:MULTISPECIES: sugar phosphate isomerase/epimerase family protein [unclassified Mesorhizobium]|uniref:sugar phosphate isomerase/epimerase family protein n=1 Tax=unclassified Mesorhizobium TaxID=325217 RepID=UPI0003CEF887|nr:MULTISPECIES: sugar phosphate isomerase/epimerase family protein [unclassified Mesorhizobium]ESY15979.1 AP endonuclease [Mesorhizobium sp. LNJC391B00]ESY30054.1 AP endonuclease [Mesorhizobium sp. LNJC384A00]